ncbi:MAG: single-stranded-DNA-specific exonuclease RecJ [Flavobacteriales bacterium]|jgi:single-stranded-DNA-specific exonuclease|nr:single-stranded-DNA-specific exonuclease RecJ [Flavobacteriales bacterium]
MKPLEKQWSMKPVPSAESVLGFQNAINASGPLATLLMQREIRDFESARLFFNPKLERLHPPFLMKDMQVAVDRITKAINTDEHILVYGDYDVDGTTAVSLLYSFLLEHYPNVSYYIPDRYGEGYGVSLKGIDFAEDNDVSLMIALDCGIKAVDQVDYAAGKNIDFIICDHHLPGKSIPKAVAILNPLQSDCTYPDKYLSGCGIGFKLAQALTQAWDLDKHEPYKYLDLVAIAAACDIVPLIGENRVLCHFGIQLIEEAMRPGLKLLLENAGRLVDGRLKKDLTIGDIVFAIGPRINAAGRMEHGQLAVELLTSTTTKAAEIPASRVNENNTTRREVDKQMLEQALAMVQELNENTVSTVLFDPNWHKGVVGIVASRVQDVRYRPTIILTEAEGMATGSARSVEGFDVHAAIESCADLLDTYGGHRAAAGLTMKLENLEEFRDRFEAAVDAVIDPSQLIPSIPIDLELKLHQINMRFYNSMNRMAPFGPENMRPVFVSHNLKDTKRSKKVGDGSHLKLEVCQSGVEAQLIRGIAFGLGHMLDEIEDREFSAVYTLEINEFNGVKSLELMVRDIKVSAS